MTFIMDQDIYPQSTPLELRWMPTKTIYDPCPEGYRVPDGGRYGFWHTSRIEVKLSPEGNGVYWTLADGSMAWYPCTGIIHCTTADLSHVAEWGMYWASTIPDYYLSAHCLHTSGDNPDESVNRGHGQSVRCVRE